MSSAVLSMLSVLLSSQPGGMGYVKEASVCYFAPASRIAVLVFPAVWKSLIVARYVGSNEGKIAVTSISRKSNDNVSPTPSLTISNVGCFLRRTGELNDAAIVPRCDRDKTEFTR